MEYVYLIEMVGTPYVKVGVACNPDARRGDLQVASPFLLRVREQGMYRDAYAVEDMIKENLSIWRVRGEWFHWPEDWTLDDAVNAPAYRASLSKWLDQNRPRLEAVAERLDKCKVGLDRWMTNAAIPREEVSAERLKSIALDIFRCTDSPKQSPHLPIDH